MQEKNRNRGMRMLLGLCVSIAAGCIHVEMGVESFSSYPERNGWQDLDDGKMPVHITAFLEQAHDAAYGLPYLFYVTTDKLPHQLHFVFATSVARRPDKVDVTKLKVRHKTPSKQSYDLLGDGEIKTGVFTLDDRGKEWGDTPYYRVNIPIPDAIKHRSSFTIELEGALVFAEGREPFAQTVEVEYIRERYVSPGIYAWALRDL